MSKTKTTEEFINDSIKVHGNLYDYTKVNYIGNKKKVDIICKIHGIFKQTPSNHLSGHMCIFCAGLNKKTTYEFIKEANEIHSTLYDYSKVEYISNKHDVEIICNKHGIFKQNPITHLNGSICPQCNNDIRRKSNHYFINESKVIHHNRYDYSKCNYVGSRIKVDIICNKHGIFSQNPRLHLEGKGCPTCKQSKGEIFIENFLKENKIEFDRQKRFKDCKLIYKLSFDFYISEQNICIEYNGRQHYQEVRIFGGKSGFEIQQIRDDIKQNYCKINNIILFIVKYDDDINIRLNELITIISQDI